MKPVSPVLPGQPEVIYAENQPEYNPLPAIRDDDGTVTTRWKLSWRERLVVLLKGDIYLELLTFNRPLQPVRLAVVPPTLVDAGAVISWRELLSGCRTQSTVEDDGYSSDHIRHPLSIVKK